MRTRALAARLRTRPEVEAYRARRLRRFLRDVVPRTAFYAGRLPHALTDLPIMDKAAVLADFAALNTAGVTLEEARAAIDAGRERVRGLTVGQSTGTSGTRGVYVISEAERFTWLGVILAKALPEVWRRRWRVAVALPGVGRLYASAAESGRVALRGFDPADGIAAWAGEMADFAPEAIVAAPKTLRVLAARGDLAPERVFSGGEVLDPLDRAALERAWGVRVREIYMATEGLLGVACPLGVLHLAEDCVAFEWEEAGGGLVAPLVTDFTRRTQVMARYRMNDLLRLADAPCACGSPLQAVAAVEGRCDDLLVFPGEEGEAVVTPDVARNAVVDADRRIDDFRVTQTGPGTLELRLAADLPDEAAEAARRALARALERLGARPALDVRRGIEPAAGDRKLRRVRGLGGSGPSP